MGPIMITMGAAAMLCFAFVLLLLKATRKSNEPEI